MNPHTRPLRDAGLSNHWVLRRLGAAVMIRRLELDLDQTGLAARIGIPAATVDAIKHGRYDPRLALTVRLEDALEPAPGTLGEPSAGRHVGEGSR